MKRTKNLIIVALCIIMLLPCLSACSSIKAPSSPLDAKNPTTVTIWNYYNGDQLAGFEKLVSEFNETVGAEKGIVVVSVSQGSINNLAAALLDSVSGKVGAADVPSLASVYAETAYILNAEGAIVPLDAYLTQEEIDEYIPSFIDEGRLTDGGSLMLFPVSKSTEAFIVNTTDWAPFAADSGINVSDVTSFEALTDAAEKYYEWTDAQTPDIPNDGKSLYGRDSAANYIYIGTKQLGHEIFTVDSDGTVKVDMDRDAFLTLWKNYYIPYINGYFGSFGRYRSEDIKTGNIIAMTGSTSGVSYIASTVTSANDVSYDIDVSINRPLGFANAVENVAVQQGAGYCVLKTSEAEQYAAVEFLKWFTDTDQNLDFSISSGYSPVKRAANDKDKIMAAFSVDSPKTQNMLDSLLISSEIYTTGNAYTCRAFAGSKEVRDVLETALVDAVVNDRAAVEERMAAGMSREEAVAPYSTDEYFDAWFNALVSRVNATVS